MPEPRPQPAWLADAVLYQIYPQTFADSNGDGIGDFPGALERLEYLSWLGVDAVWFSPCFTSPFADAGYDVADYLTVAPRYGSNDDLVALVDAARAKGIRVLLDLVAGHTSDQHPWFRAWADDPTDHRFIGSAKVGSPAGVWSPTPGRRGGYYMLNFYPCQPALNFGYARQNEREPWRQPVDADGPRANRRALRDVMAYWFDRGISGFRVDMAASLVKDDPGLVETGRLWTDMRAWIDQAYPECALLSEWGDPSVAVPSGFHADFFLQFRGPALRSLWHTGIGTHDSNWGEIPGFYFDAEGSGTHRGVPGRVAGGDRGDRHRRRPHRAADRQPRLRPPGHRPARRRPGAGRVRVPDDLAVAADHLLRRRDRHALHRGPARQGGQHPRAAEQPHRLAYADAVGRLAQRGLLDRPGRPALPADRPRPGPADGGRPARRRGLAAAPRTAADRPAEGDAGARAGRLARRAARGLPAGLHPRRHPPGGGQPPPGAGGRSAAGGPHRPRRPRGLRRGRVEAARSRPTASGTGSSRWARARGVPPTRSGSRSARPSRAGRAGRRRWRRRSGGRCRAVPWCGCPAPGARATRVR